MRRNPFPPEGTRMLVRPLLALLTSALVFVFAAGCGDRETTPHDALLDPSIELPHAARYGKAPPREGRVTIAVTSEGRVLVDETACTLEDLAATLRERLGRDEDPGLRKVSRPPQSP